MAIIEHEHQWVPWDAYKMTVCDFIECGAAKLWSGGEMFDRHRPDGTMKSRRELNSPLPFGEVTQTDLDVLQRLLLALCNTQDSDSWSASCQASLEDEYGWSSSGSPVLMWEEGYDDWAYSFGDDPTVAGFLAGRGLRVEPIKSWMVGVYPA